MKRGFVLEIGGAYYVVPEGGLMALLESLERLQEVKEEYGTDEWVMVSSGRKAIGSILLAVVKPASKQ